MRKNNELLKVALAVSLTAMSVVIDVLLKYVININSFGLPFYAIPIIIGSVMLGPIYGVMMALVGDALGVLFAGYAYQPLYALAAVGWGGIPGLFMFRKYSAVKLVFAVLVAYIFASLSNTFANYFYWGQETTMATLAARLLLLPVNSAVIFIISHVLYVRLSHIAPEYMMIKRANNTQ